MYQLRVALAWGAFALCALAFLAHGAYLWWLDTELTVHGNESAESRRRPPDPRLHSPREMELLRRYARAKRLSTPIWLGAIVLGTLLYVLLHP